MNENIGANLKDLSKLLGKVLLILGIVGGAVLSIYIETWLPVILGTVYGVVSYWTCMLGYALGQLVENTAVKKPGRIEKESGDDEIPEL